ncbi:hypothetical protein [Macrococcus armenti]|uniref:hypothetical protein n=1 Tax=Macrococcus armenti TaxID=2875764 RepID=UPI001CC95479|nr:hypothetical protein [Macrococcus armenti]UBH15668.1 hypothetical protein LAU44_01555 [Macrococcus armenti]UBH18029.1 hypothetical protein LAU39_01560 [Macrococcus armenti]UBH20294.1 hypothetical protein LAU40_01555 [Macrococcus armenti]
MYKILTSLFFSVIVGLLFAFFSMSLKLDSLSSLTSAVIIEFVIRTIIAAIIYKIVSSIVLKMVLKNQFQ